MYNQTYRHFVSSTWRRLSRSVAAPQTPVSPDARRIWTQADGEAIYLEGSDDSSMDPMESHRSSSVPSEAPAALRTWERTTFTADSRRNSATLAVLSPATAPSAPLPPPPGIRNHPSEPRLSLSNWAPVATRPSAASTFTHLPLAPESGPWTGQTSLPNTSVKPSDLEHSLVRLLSPALFEAFVTAESGRRSFQKYLSTTARGSGSLDLWWDLKVLQRLSDQIRLATLGVRDVYLLADGAKKVELPPKLLEDTAIALGTMMGTGRLSGPTTTLLGSLYANEFQVSSLMGGLSQIALTCFKTSRRRTLSID